MSDLVKKFNGKFLLILFTLLKQIVFLLLLIFSLGHVKCIKLLLEQRESRVRRTLVLNKKLVFSMCALTEESGSNLKRTFLPHEV